MGDELKVTQADCEAAKDAWEKAALADLYCDPRNTGPDFGPEPRDPEGILAEAFARHRIATETQSQATIDELVAGLAAIVDGEIERPLGKRWREDRKPSKNDTCIHGAWMYECCEGCIDAHVLAILSRHKGGQS